LSLLWKKGIFAADRAQMAFDGRIHNVTYESFKHLALRGTDIIFTEKEGLVNTIVPFTTNKGIALVQSGGWSSEYAIFLIEAAHNLGFKNIGILTDFDSQGVGIAMQFPYVVRLGVDLQTVSDLGVNLASVRERIKPLKWNNRTGKEEENSHWIGLNTKLDQMNDTHHYKQFLKDNLKFLRTNRIELGAITAAVGAGHFWEWLRKKILTEFPTRDYNRALDVPMKVYPDALVELMEKIDNKIESVLLSSWHYWYKKLSRFDGFVDNTKDKLEEIESDLYNDLVDNDDIKSLIKDLNVIKKRKYLD
jgi:hypothetical protein